MASAALLVAPELITSAKGVDFEEKLPCEMWFRGAWPKKKAARGASAIYLLNRGAADEFNIGDYHKDETAGVTTLAKVFGGHYLLLWTYGNSINAFYVRAEQDGRKPLQLESGFRLDAFAGKRPAHLFEDFISWFEDSPFKPDVKALRQQYQSERISVVAWMKAFGVPGAREVEAVETGEYWADFDNVAKDLLEGSAANAKLIRRLNQLLKQQDEDVKLPTKRLKREGSTARKVAEAAYSLKEAIGNPEEELWQERKRAAKFYWDFTDCEPAHQRLTYGCDKKGLGESASFARLMPHYPKPLMRDGVFWALAAMEAEGANGHAFVNGLTCFAEHAHQAGFSMAVVPTEQHGAFRSEFGIESWSESSPLDAKWSAEAFVDLPGILKEQADERIKNWFTASGTDGVCLRADADGSWNLEFFKEGEVVERSDAKSVIGSTVNEKKLSAAVREFDFAEVCKAFDLPDLFEPGEWREGAYGGTPDDQTLASESEKKRKEALAAAPSSFDVKVIVDSSCIFSVDEIAAEREKGIETRVRIARFYLVFPELNEAILRDLRSDICGSGVIDGYGDAWVEGEQLFGVISDRASSAGRTSRSIWRKVLGGLPDGSVLHFVLEDSDENEQLISYKIDSAGAEPVSAKRIQQWLETPEFDNKEDHSDCGYDLDDPLEREIAFGEKFSEGIGDESLIGELLLNNGDERSYFTLDLWTIEDLKSDHLLPLAEQLSPLGFAKLGDVYCDEVSDAFMRSFGSEQEPSILCALLVFKYGEPIVEFYTEFDNQTSITTTTNVYVQSMVEKGVLYESMEEDTAAVDLLAKHKEMVAELCADGRKPIKLKPSLAGFVEAVESVNQRMTAA